MKPLFSTPAGNSLYIRKALEQVSIYIESNYSLVFMSTIYCSGKLASFIGSNQLLPVDQSKLTNPIARFNAHLFYFRRAKCIVFTNKATLYSVVRLNVLKKDIKDFSSFFKVSLLNQLKADDLFDGDEFWKPFFSDPVFYKTDNDKKVLGSMNDQIYQLKASLEYGNLSLDPTDTNAGTNINTLIMRLIKYSNPIESLTQLKQKTNHPSDN